MDFSMVIDALATQGIWCLLFVWLFYTDRTDSKEREEKLQNIINEHGKQLERITDTLATIDNKIDKLETVTGAHVME